MKKIMSLTILCLLFLVGIAYAQIGYDGKTVYPRVPGGDIMHYPSPGIPKSTGYAWDTSYTVGTMTDSKYCTYTAATNTISCNSEGGGGGSMTWPGTAGIPVYSGSSSWSTSIAHPGAANRVLYTDSTTTYSWASTHSHSNDGAQFYASSDDTRKILMDPSGNATGVTQTIASTAKAAATYSLPPATAKPGDSLLSTTTISFASNADTTLYTVPTGLRCVLTKAIVVANGDAGASTTISIGANGTETDFIPANTLSNLDAPYDAVILMPIPNTTPLKSKSYAAGTVIDAKVENQSGTTGNTIYLFGFLY